MPDPQFNLTVLVRALMEERELRAQFNRDPERVIREFGLTSKERLILYKMDPTVIEEFLYPPVDGQIGGYNIPQGEFNPAGPDCVPDPGVVMPSYPIPKPGLFRVRPRRLTPDDVMVVDNAGTLTRYIEFSVFGQTFSRQPAPEVEVRHQGSNATLQIDSTHLFGTMRCSQLTVLAIVQGTAAEIGTYEIRLTNNPATANPDPIQNVLTLELAP